MAEEVHRKAPSKEPPQAPQGALFNSINDLRDGGQEKDQDAIDREKINDTVFGHIAKSKKFEYTTLAIIVVNALFIGYDADFSARWAKPENLYDCTGFAPGSCYQFIFMENLFAVYFTAEVVIRFFSYKRKGDMCTDLWFIFDSVLVMFMVIETWILPIVGASGPLAQLSVLRLLRLLRITRMAKLMRFFPELQIIVKGMLAAVRSVICTAILLILILYVFSILFTSEFHQGDLPDDECTGAQALFGTMGKSMRHLFIMGTILDDITLCCNSIRSSNKMVPMMTAFVMFVLISSFTMLNMLIGILCEVVCATGEGERNKNTECHVKEAITELFMTMDRNNDGEISREEFLKFKDSRKVMKALKELEVEAKHFGMYAQLLFMPEEAGGPPPKLDFNKVLSMILRLRPGTKVSALDFASFQMSVYRNHDSLKKNISNIEKMASVLTGQDLSALPPAKTPDAKIGVSTLPALEQAPEQDILAELQRRIGSFSANGNPPISAGPGQKALLPQFPNAPDLTAWSADTYNY
jgi:hypothetical protein